MVNKIRVFIKDLEDKYDINADGIIMSPGRFEGEHVATLWYYDAAMNGGAYLLEECGGHECMPNSGCCECSPLIWHDEFEITEAEKTAFPHLKGKNYFMLTYQSNGFVVCLCDRIIGNSRV